MPPSIRAQNILYKKYLTLFTKYLGSVLGLSVQTKANKHPTKNKMLSRSLFEVIVFLL